MSLQIRLPCSTEGRYYLQTRHWRPRRQREEAAWSALLPQLTASYLRYKYSLKPSESTPGTCVHSTTGSLATETTQSPGVHSDPVDANTPPAAPPTTNETSAPAIWEFDVFDLFSLKTQGRVTRRPDSENPALDLMEHGYVAKTPGKPQVAVSVRTLELLFRLRNRKPSFSIEAFTKVICDYYAVSLPRSQCHLH